MSLKTPFFHYCKISLTLCFIILYSSLVGQQNTFVFDNYSVKDGLSHNNVYSIFQDNSGYLWLGTQDGLNKFDGHKFTTYRSIPNNPNSLSTNNFGKIFQDSSGIYWFGTYGKGIDLYNSATHIFKNLSNSLVDSTSLSGDLTACIFNDSFGDIWIGMENGGLNKYNKKEGNFIRYQHKETIENSLSNSSANCICETSDGTIWVGTGNGLNKFNKESQTFTHYYHNPYNENTLSGNVIQHMVVDDEDNIWIAVFNGGLNKFNPETSEVKRYKQNVNDAKTLSDNNVEYLFIDSYNQFWVGTYEGGLNLFDKNTGEFIHCKTLNGYNEELCFNKIEYIIEDNSNVLWVATRGSGLYKHDLKPQKFKNLIHDPSNSQSLSDNNITAIDEDAKGNLWIGTDGGGLTKFIRKEQKYTHFKYSSVNQNTPSGNRIWSVLVDEQGVIWAGSFGNGLTRIEHRNGEYYFTRYRHSVDDGSSISSNQINSIVQDQNSDIWIGTSIGLNKLIKAENVNDYTFKQFLYNPLGPINYADNYISHLCIDSSNRIWVGSTVGLLEFLPKRESFKKHPLILDAISDSISSYRVFHVYEERNNSLLIGTESYGIFNYDTKKSIFNAHSINAQLNGNAVMGIIKDLNDNLWISTSNALVNYNSDLDESYSYSFNDGIVGVGFNRSVVLNSKNGDLYFGSNAGLTYFNPIKIVRNVNLPKTVITSFNVLNKPLLADVLLPYEKFKNKKDIISLARKDYFFTIEFAALDYTSPEENKYKYKLENFDQDWIDVGSNRKATYTNLDPGTYVFKVKGSNSDKFWNDKPTELIIKIIPPFWKKGWFYLIELLAVIAIFLTYVRVRTYVLVQDKKNLEKNVKERTDKINQQNEELTVQAQHLEETNKALGNQHVELERLVKERTSDLEIAKNKAEESDRLKSAFLANMSHELRTPMNAIVGFSELLKIPEIDMKSQCEFADHIVDNSRSLLKLISDIIDISKIEVGEISLFIEEFNLYTFMEDNFLLIKETNRNPEVDILLKLEPSTNNYIVKTDIIRLKQVLDNFINNAIKFTEKGKIEFGFTLEKQNTILKFFVHDTGIGLDQEQQNFIFSRFTKIEDDKGKLFRGAGLGLPIAKNLVELMGGKVWAKSELGKGASFYFTLPVCNV